MIYINHILFNESNWIFNGSLITLYVDSKNKNHILFNKNNCLLIGFITLYVDSIKIIHLKGRK